MCVLCSQVKEQNLMNLRFNCFTLRCPYKDKYLAFYIAYLSASGKEQNYKYLPES